MEHAINHFLLKNGMNLIIINRSFSPRVCMQLFYNVGSKNENDKNRGIAHMIEHMIFKGTEKLSEGAIDTISYKLSASCNAFTSYDYTGYLFELPSENYTHILPLMADCMINCKFNQEHLNSELKAVFQELKMYNDNNFDLSFRKIMHSVFYDHNYKHPIIGYKDTILNFKSEDLKEFYKKYYNPKNAVLVISGDVNVDECLKNVRENFENIESKDSFEVINKSAFHEKDLFGSSFKIYRDVESPNLIFAWEVPPCKIENQFLYSIFSNLIGCGRGSVLYKKLVYEKELVIDVSAFIDDLFEYGIFYIYIQPKDYLDAEKIEKIIFEELSNIIKNSDFKENVQRAYKKAKMDNVSIAEDNQKLGFMAAKFFMTEKDPFALNKYTNINENDINIFIENMISKYLIKETLNKVEILPLNKEKIDIWKKIQNEKDEFDKKELSKIIRNESTERKEINFNPILKETKKIKVPDYTKKVLSNGLTLYIAPLKFVDKVEICLNLKVKHYYDPIELEGRIGFLFDLMEEGTKKYPGNEFGEKLESYGMDFYAGPGILSLSCLPEDIEKAFDFIDEYLTNPEFSNSSFNRVKEQTLISIKDFWDDASFISKQLIRENIYGDHLYGRNPSGSIDKIKKLSLESIKDAFKNFVSLNEAVMVVCGPVDEDKIVKEVETFFEKGASIKLDSPLKEFPKKPNFKEIKYNLNRDQSVISYGGLSVKRFDKNYDPLLVFDQIFGSGVTNSMSSMLFSLREKTGMFYSINGSLISGCAEHNGMFQVRAITSPDLTEKSFKMIEDLFDNIFEKLNEENIAQGKRVIISSLSDLFSTYKSVATTLIFMHQYNLNKDFYENRDEMINSVTEKEIRDAVQSIINKENIIKLTVGR